MAEHFVEMPDTPRLADDPGMQMQHHQASGGRAIGIEAIEPLAPQEVDLVDGPAAVEVDVVIIEVGMDAERIELPGLRRLLEVGARPADRALARGPFDRLDRVADVPPLLVFRHADMDDAPARETV